MRPLFSTPPTPSCPLRAASFRSRRCGVMNMDWMALPATGGGVSRITRLAMSVAPVVTNSRTWPPVLDALPAIGIVSVLTPSTSRTDAEPSGNDVSAAPSVSSSSRRKRSVRGGMAAWIVTRIAASLVNASRDARIDSSSPVTPPTTSRISVSKRVRAGSSCTTERFDPSAT